MAREGIVQKVNPYELHGVPNYQLAVSFVDEPNSVRDVRIAHDAIYANPADGDRVLVEMVLNVVTEVRKKA